MGAITQWSVPQRIGTDTNWRSITTNDIQTAALKRDGIDCSTQIDEGDPAEVIVRLAEECGADLLVIGNRGMQRRVLGSVPNTVTHRAPCSVLVVKTT